MNSLICNEGFYLPEDNKEICQKCSIDECQICSGNINNDICYKCFDEFFPEIENDKIIFCNKRIDIVKNGKLVDGIIENKGEHVQKTQLEDGIKYYVSATCTTQSSGNWWNVLGGNCLLPIVFNFSQILPNNKSSLEHDYILYLNATEKFTGKARYYPHDEFQVSPTFWMQCDNVEWSIYDSRIYCSNTFGYYKDLERVNHNGKIFLGGVFNRGYDYYQLEKFNYTQIIGKGSQVIGWTFLIEIGDFQSETGTISITFIVYDLYLLKKKN